MLLQLMFKWVSLADMLFLVKFTPRAYDSFFIPQSPMLFLERSNLLSEDPVKKVERL